jgi:hypothetical protein
MWALQGLHNLRERGYLDYRFFLDEENNDLPIYDFFADNKDKYKVNELSKIQYIKASDPDLKNIVSKYEKWKDIDLLLKTT